jgi:diadenosine tetraphosphate (Ap4A) HIT family hydrolase
MDCIFCKIVSGDSPAHKVWEDDQHLAFLSIFPNTPGVTVVIPKKHYPSYVFDLPPDVYANLIQAARTVGKLLDSKLEDVGRTAMVFEGFGVDHAHVKLFPMHGTKMADWKPVHSKINKYFDKYEGYISSHDADRADDAELEALAKKLRG